VTRTPLSRSKGQGRQVALLSAALTRKAAAAVSMGTYSAWKSTATLRLLCGARGARAPTGEERAGHIVSPRAQLVTGQNAVIMTRIVRQKNRLNRNTVQCS